MPVTDLPEDVLIHILEFQEPDDQLEAGHAHFYWLSAVRQLRPRPRSRVCRECFHPETYCLCEKRAKRAGVMYFLLMIFIVAFCFSYPFLTKN